MSANTDALTKRIARAICEVDNAWERTTPEFRAEFDVYSAAVLPIVAVEVRKATAEALRAWASGVESQLDATADKGIELGEWGRGLRSGAQQARDTADHIETGDQR